MTSKIEAQRSARVGMSAFFVLMLMDISSSAACWRGRALAESNDFTSLMRVDSGSFEASFSPF